MAEILLQVVADTVLKKVESLLTEQMSLVLGFKKQLTTLRDSLDMIQAVLSDAERRQSRDKGVKVWLKRLKDVAYDADDVLDEFAYEILRRKVEIKNQMRRKVFFFFSSSNPIAFRLKMGNKIKGIITSLDKINEDAIKFGLQRGSVGMVPPQVAVNRETDSFVDTSRVIGRDHEAEKIVEMLVNPGDQEALSVIPIVGMGGLGKTTLAKKIYHDERINVHFQVKIWVCVSNNFDTKRLLIGILESLKGEKCDLQNRDDILRKLEKELGEKKYFLILDDVWNEDPSDWEDFRSCLLGVNKTKGNNILVTTRKQGVAFIMGTRDTHCLEGLSEEDCWSIVKQKAFAVGGAPMTPELETIGIEIARKCHGVPLAANVTGGMLFAKKERHEWLEIQNSQIWGSVTDEKGVLGILKLSFDNLPYSSLKQCFAYCSIFPQDTYMEKERLIQLWMAVGFLQSDEESNKLMEVTGNEFFNVILWNSLFQDVKKDECDNIIGCQMHDLVHDLARRISKCESYSLEDVAVKVIPDVRHLALYSSGDIINTMLKEKAGYLHTLFLRSGMPQNTEDFKCLRVLNFGRAEIKELSNSIGALIHLRYLDLSDTEIQVLPVSICKLYNLQTLRLDGCKSLKELPNKLSNLTSLRHLHLDTFYHHFKIPVGIGQLVCLQTLSFFSVGQVKGHQLNELGFLKHLGGKLEIRNLEQVIGIEEAQRAELFRKTNLYKLSFVWGDNREGVFNDEDVLEGLKPHPNLKSLAVSNFLGDKFPTWMMKMAVNIDGTGDWLPLDSLMEIKLAGCERCEHIPMLGQLPNLRYLELWEMNNVARIDLSFYGHRNDSPNNTRTNETSASFPALIKFALADMPNLEEWMEAEDDRVVFPRLEELLIHSCPKLTKFPSRFPCLKKLVVGGLPELSFYGHRNDSPNNTRTNETSASFPALIEFTLYGMANLEEWMEGEDDDVVFPRLEELTIQECPKLTKFPSRFPCLKKLVVGGLVELPFGDDHVAFPHLEELRIKRCPKLTTFPSRFPRLKKLRVSGLDELGCLPDGLFENNKDPKLTTMRGCCSSLLQELEIRKCSKLSNLPDGLHTLLFLERLEIRLCKNLNSIGSIQGLKSLKVLDISKCEGLTCLPSGLLQFCTSLQQLSIDECEGLTCLPSGLLQFCTSLQELRIDGCEGLTCLPSGLLQFCTSLQTLFISGCRNLISVPELTACCSLSLLIISSCRNLISLPELTACCSLSVLEISGCEKLSCLPEGLGCLTGLKYLCLGPLSDDVTSFSALNAIQQQHFTALTYLLLDGYGAEALPDCFSNLSSLTRLYLYNCERLKCLPAREPLAKLIYVDINNCPLLKERWSEIAPHAEVIIDGTTVSDMSK